MPERFRESLSLAARRLFGHGSTSSTCDYEASSSRTITPCVDAATSQFNSRAAGRSRSLLHSQSGDKETFRRHCALMQRYSSKCGSFSSCKFIGVSDYAAFLVTANKCLERWFIGMMPILCFQVEYFAFSSNDGHGCSSGVELEHIQWIL